MGKFTNKKDKLNFALIFSGFLHLILMVFIIASSSSFKLDAADQDNNANVMNAVMVDSAAITQQYRRQKNQESESRLTLERQQKKARQQAERLLKKQNEEQQRLKNLEKERLLAQENAKQEAEERKRQMEKEQQHLAEQQKQAIEAIKKAQKEQKQAEAEAAKAKAQADRLKAEAEKRAQAEQKRKMEAAKARKESAKIKKQVDELFDNLASSQNTTKSHATAEGKNGSDAEINGYLNQIISAIQSKFYDPNLYKGKTCNLRIKLALDGALISVTEEGGDPALCQAAVAAAKQAPIPEPPNKNVYQIFKNASLVFKP